MTGIGFHDCQEHKARQLDDCPYCRIEALEAENAWYKLRFERDELKATLLLVAKVRDELATQCLNNHAVKMLDAAIGSKRIAL